jgi:hypothetical protein
VSVMCVSVVRSVLQSCSKHRSGVWYVLAAAAASSLLRTGVLVYGHFDMMM